MNKFSSGPEKLKMQFTFSPLQTLVLVEKGAMFSELVVGAKTGDIKKVSRLLSMDTLKDKDKALHFACKHGRLEIVKLLLSAGANVNSKYDGGWCPGTGTPLHWALHEKSIEIVQVLLFAGANVNKSHLHMACLYGSQRLIDMILLYMKNLSEIQSYTDGPKFKRLRLACDLVKKHQRMINGLRKIQFIFLDKLWRPNGVLCNRNYINLFYLTS